jgi:hypothetical protein
MSELLVVESKARVWNRLRKEIARDDEQGRALEKELKELDPRLRVRFVGRIPEGHFSPGMKENRWHILREGEFENSIDHYLPILGPDMEYRPPEMKVVEDMKKADLWREGALDKLFDERERQVKANQAKADLKREQLKDTFVEELRAAKRSRNETELMKRAAPKKAGE